MLLTKRLKFKTRVFTLGNFDGAFRCLFSGGWSEPLLSWCFTNIKYNVKERTQHASNERRSLAGLNLTELRKSGSQDQKVSMRRAKLPVLA